MIQGRFIALLTFPGVIIHEFAHMLFCMWTGTRVTEVKYFRFGSPAGYVIHEHPSNAWKAILIGVGPFLVNTILGLVIALSASSLRGSGNITVTVLWAVLIWLAVSVAMHSFPSTGDAKAIWSTVMAKNRPIVAKIVAIPIVGFIYLGALGSIFWLDLGYALVVTVVLPTALGITVWY